MDKIALINDLNERKKEGGLPALLIAGGLGSLLGGTLNKAFNKYDLSTDEGRSKAQKDEGLSRLAGGAGGLLAALLAGAGKQRGLTRTLGRAIW